MTKKNSTISFEPRKGQKYLFKDNGDSTTKLRVYIGKLENLFLTVSEKDYENLKQNTSVSVSPFEECYDCKVLSKREAEDLLSKIQKKQVIILD